MTLRSVVVVSESVYYPEALCSTVTYIKSGTPCLIIILRPSVTVALMHTGSNDAYILKE